MNFEQLAAVFVAAATGGCVGCVAGLYFGVRVMVEPLKVALKEMEERDADDIIAAALRRQGQ